MSYFSSIASINRIDLCIVSIKIYLICSKIYYIYLIHSYLIFYLGQGHCNILRSFLYKEILAVYQLITPNTSAITQKKD